MTLELARSFLGLTAKTKVTKAKINKRDYIKLKIFCTAEETINKMQRQPTKREKILTIPVSDKGLMFKLHKKLIQLHTIKMLLKWADKHFNFY